MKAYEWPASEDCPPAAYVEVFRRPKEVERFVPLPGRQAVERAPAWAGCYRRHGRARERKPSRTEALVQLGMTDLMLARLAPDDRYPPFHYQLAT